MPQSEEFATAALLNGQLYPLLTQASRAEVLASMSRELAHDLKGPIQAFFLFDLEDRGEEMASVFRMAVDKMAETIERVTRIYLPRPLARSIVPLTVTDLLSAARDMYEAQRTLPEAELVIDASPTLPPILVHEWECQHAVINLLMNAREAAGAGPGARVTVSVRQAGPMVEFSVRDSGPGIPPDRADWVFAPLTTTKQAPGVHGLGLPVARYLAEKNGGTLRLERSERGGWFVLALKAVTHH